MKILVVEDDPNLNKSICEMLKNLAEVDAVYDGEEALFQARQDIYDLILLDIMIPFIDGFTVLSKIREFSNCPVFNSDGTR
jgi:two-component system response regulator CiaR